MGIRYRTVDVNHLFKETNLLKKKPCPYFTKPYGKRYANNDTNYILIPQDEIYQRKEIIPRFEYNPTYIVWVQNHRKRLFLFVNFYK